MGNIHKIVEPYIQEILYATIRNNKKTVQAKQVLTMLLEIEQQINEYSPEIIIDGDEMVKYFNQKYCGCVIPDTIESTDN